MRAAVLRASRYVPWLLALVFPALAGFGPPRLVESDRQQLPVYAGQLGEIADATPPDLKGVAALIMDAATGRVVYERNGYHHIAPASLTKLMTALVAVERSSRSPEITWPTGYVALKVRKYGETRVELAEFGASV